MKSINVITMKRIVLFVSLALLYSIVACRPQNGETGIAKESKTVEKTIPIEKNKGAATMIFATMMTPDDERDALLAAASIRKFAGSLAGSDIWFFIPEQHIESCAEETMKRLSELSVTVIPIAVDQTALSFPYAAKVYAAAVAEEMAINKTSTLFWMDPDTIIIRDPSVLSLPASAELGYRPVFIPNVGSRFDEPVDDFWRLVYEECKTPENRIFSMNTAVNNIPMRPYFNAGCLVVKPEAGILRAWRDTFHRSYRQKKFIDFYRKDSQFAIFVHQAILSGVIPALLSQEKLHEYPDSVNYSLYFNAKGDYPVDRRKTSFADLTTCRYEWFFDDPQWPESLPEGDLIGDWLKTERDLIEKIIPVKKEAPEIQE